MRSLSLILSMIVLLFASSVLAQGDGDAMVDRGNAAYQAGDFQTALSIYRPLAEAGNARAQANLGNMYNNGVGVAQSDDKAIFWLTKAAEQRQPAGALWLGLKYDLGKGVPVNHVKALRYFEIAADGGRGEAAFYAGTMHANGEGTVADLTKARAYFKIGADLGNKDAANAYGYYLEGGFGGDVDLTGAISWYDFAIALGDEMATRNKSNILQWIVARGDDHMARADYDKARKSYDFACLNALGQGCYRLAELLYRGRGGPVDKAGSLALSEKACDYAIPDACETFADVVIELGRGVDDSRKAVNVLEPLCFAGGASQCHNLAYLLLHGTFGVYDYQGGKSALARGCTGGNAASCGPYNEMVSSEGTPAASTGGQGDDFLDFMIDLAGGLATASSGGGFNSTTCGSCGSYGGSGGSGGDAFASTNAAQDNRNFDVFIQSNSSYGGTCPASNPYC